MLSENTKGINDFDTTSLRDLFETITKLRAIARDSFLGKELEKAVKRQQAVEGSVENMRSNIGKEDSPKTRNKKKNLLLRAFQSVNFMSRGFREIVAKLDSIKGGHFFKEVLYRKISKGNSEYFIMEESSRAKDLNIFKEIFNVSTIKGVPEKILNSKIDRGLKRMQKQKLYKGDLNMWLSDSQMLDLYITSKMETNKKELQEKGMYVGGNNPSKRVVVFDDSMIRQIQKEVDNLPHIKKLADYITKELSSTEFQNKIESAFKDKWNKPFNKVAGGYWPMFRYYLGHGEQGLDIMTPTTAYKPSLSPKTLKERVENDNPLKIGDGLEKFLSWRTEMQRFIAYDKAFSDIVSIIHAPEFKGEFIEMFGRHPYNQLVDSFAYTVQGGGQYNDAMAWAFNQIRSTLSVVMVGGKIRNVFAQGSSAVASMAEIPIKDFGEGLVRTVTSPQKAYDKMMEHPSIKFRAAKSGFSKGMMESEMKGYQKQGMNTAETMMIFTRIGDMAGVTGAGYSVYLSKLKMYKDSGISDTKANELALDDAADFVNSTQQSSLPEYSNWIMRQHPWIRTFGQFQQAQNMYRNKLEESVTTWINSENKWTKKDLQKVAKGILTYQYILPISYELSKGNFNFPVILSKAVMSPISGYMGFGTPVYYGLTYAMIHAVAPLFGADPDDYKEYLPFKPSSLGGEALEIFTRASKSFGEIIRDDYDAKDIYALTDAVLAGFKISSKNIREEIFKTKDIITGKDRSLIRVLETSWQTDQRKNKEFEKLILNGKFDESIDYYIKNLKKGYFGGMEKGEITEEMAKKFEQKYNSKAQTLIKKKYNIVTLTGNTDSREDLLKSVQGIKNMTTKDFNFLLSITSKETQKGLKEIRNF
jgi:hypothetical protein